MELNTIVEIFKILKINTKRIIILYVSKEAKTYNTKINKIKLILIM